MVLAQSHLEFDSGCVNNSVKILVNNGAWIPPWIPLEHFVWAFCLGNLFGRSARAVKPR
jgi:hypothetical protein